MFYPTYSKSPGLCSLNIIKSPIQFVCAGVLILFCILNAFNCGFLAFVSSVENTIIFVATF